MASGHDREADKGLIFGKYELLERLGRGGMAEVFKALSVGVAGFSRPVVIKRILPHLAANKQFVDMFVKEASIAAALDHPNIVQVFDLGRHDGDLFMVLEYVPGTDLGTLIAHYSTLGKAVPHQIVAYVGVDVCKALECAHGHRDERGKRTPVIHRDVSPQNVLLSVAGHVKLADFGLATPVGAARVTMPGIIKGKLAYMSPEQARGARELDIRSDLFSMGIVLYEALTGRRLFVGSTPADTIRRVRDVIVPPLSTIVKNVPGVLMDLVHSLLAKDPDARPSDAKDVRRVLSGYLRAVSPPVDATTLSSVVRQVVAETGEGEEPGEVEADQELTRAADAVRDLNEEDGRATIFAPPPSGVTATDEADEGGPEEPASDEADDRETEPTDLPEGSPGGADARETEPPEADLGDHEDARETEPPAEEGGGDGSRETEPTDLPEGSPDAEDEAPTARVSLSSDAEIPVSDPDAPVLISRVVSVGDPDAGDDTGK